MTLRTEVLRLNSVTKDFPNGEGILSLFEPIDLIVNLGDSVSIMGESASGKSTLLHIAAGLEAPTTGSVLWFDNDEEIDVSKMKDSRISMIRNRNIGFIFQNNFLLEDFLPVENLMIPALIAGRSKKEARDFALDILQKFHLEYLAKRRIGNLSGGEKQRVAICRSLINQPKLIFADEPTGSLDQVNAEAVEDILLSLSESSALILVTHNSSFGARCSVRYRLADRKLQREE